MWWYNFKLTPDVETADSNIFRGRSKHRSASQIWPNWLSFTIQTFRRRFCCSISENQKFSRKEKKSFSNISIYLFFFFYDRTVRGTAIQTSVKFFATSCKHMRQIRSAGACRLLLSTRASSKPPFLTANSSGFNNGSWVPFMGSRSKAEIHNVKDGNFASISLPEVDHLHSSEIVSKISINVICALKVFRKQISEKFDRSSSNLWSYSNRIVLKNLNKDFK